MDTATLLSTLRERDVKLWIEDDRLRCSAPTGALDADLRSALAARKDDILAVLKRAAALARAPASLVPIKPNGSRTPLFAVSGHGGDVYSLLGMARLLNADQPVLGVQPPGLDGSDPLTTVEALARYEIEQIRLVQQHGPYLIAGHCAGGTIAFEVAQQLTAAGEEVALLALIGSPFPTMLGPSAQSLVYMSRHIKALTSGPRADRVHYLKYKLTARLEPTPAPPAESAAMFEARKRVERATVAAVCAYRPTRYAGHMELFSTTEEWHLPDRWRSLAKSTGEHAIRGFEIDELLRGPDVALLAASLQRTLDARVKSSNSEPQNPASTARSPNNRCDAAL